MSYDYIIVGAPAGCILANRLSESGRHSVLLLEAGDRDASFWFRVPVGFTKTYYNRRYNWMYYSGEAQLADRKLYCPRGKVVGGSGSINAMVYVRGQRSDYDDWANAGNPAGRTTTCCRTSASSKPTRPARPIRSIMARPGRSTSRR